MPMTNTDTRHLGCGCGTTEAATHHTWLKAEDAKLTGENPKRTYIHFDKRMGKVSERAAKDVWNAEHVARHSFLPLVEVVFEERKYKKALELAGLKPIEIKERDVAYASHFDALVLSWYAFLINHFYNHLTEQLGISDVSIAYRDNKPGKNNVHFSNEVFEFIKIKDEVAVACFDVKNFFGSLDHRYLKERWRQVLSIQNAGRLHVLPEDHYNVYKAITRYTKVDRDKIYKRFEIKFKELRTHEIICTPTDLREKAKDIIVSNTESYGIPQGTPISATLSNIYMLEIDTILTSAVSAVGGMYRRYSDDILLAVPATHLKDIEKLVEEQMALAKLKLQPLKTDIVFFTRSTNGKLVCKDALGKEDKLTYLGAEFDGKHIDIRHRSFARYQRRRAAAVNGEVYKSKRDKVPLNKGRLLQKFSHSSTKNFISYMRNAAAIFKSSRIATKTDVVHTTGQLTKLIKKPRIKKKSGVRS